MKVLQINVVYGKGSTGKITADIHEGLRKRGFESIVCYGRGDKTEDYNVIKICWELYAKLNNLVSRFTGIMFGGCYFSTRRLINEIKRQQPDIVHLQCINGYFVNIYKLINWLKKNNIRTVVTLHAEFMYTGGCGYTIDCNQWYSQQGCGLTICPRWRSETKSLFFNRTGRMWKKMNDAFNGFSNISIITSVSPWLMQRAKNSAVFRDFEHRVVLNGLNESIFYPRRTNILRESLGLKNQKIIFHASPRFTDICGDLKGGYHLIEIAKRLPEYAFVVAGPFEISQEVPDNVYLLGKVNNQDKLASYYSEADLTLLVSLRETFSMVTAESLCCGTPVVGFKAGGPESIAVLEYSKFVEYGDYDQLINAIIEYSFIEVDANKCRKVYSADRMTENYISVYRELSRK